MRSSAHTHEITLGAVLPKDACEDCGLITLRDLYTWLPIAPAVNVAEFSGQSVQRSLDTILGAVFDRNPFLQRGGCYPGLANMKQKIDLDNGRFSSSTGRIVQTIIGDTALDPGKRYVFASCYGHGNRLDEVCRTGGGAGLRRDAGTTAPERGSSATDVLLREHRAPCPLTARSLSE